MLTSKTYVCYYIDMGGTEILEFIAGLGLFGLIIIVSIGLLVGFVFLLMIVAIVVVIIVISVKKSKKKKELEQNVVDAPAEEVKEEIEQEEEPK